MEYVTEFLTNDDYDTLCDWWSFWRFPSPSRDVLPDNGLGGLKVSYIDDSGNKVPCCAGFLYGTNSSLCWLEFVVSNPKVKDKKIRSESILKVIKDICLSAKSNGYKAVFSSLKNDNLINKYTEVGFSKSITNTKELTLNLSSWELQQ